MGAYVSNIFFGVQISDTQCGFKLYSSLEGKKVFNKIKTDGYMHDLEVYLIAKKMMIVPLGRLKQKKLNTIRKKKLLIIKMHGLKYTISQLYIFLNFFILIQLLKDSQVF